VVATGRRDIGGPWCRVCPRFYVHGFGGGRLRGFRLGGSAWPMEHTAVVSILNRDRRADIGGSGRGIAASIAQFRPRCCGPDPGHCEGRRNRKEGRRNGHQDAGQIRYGYSNQSRIVAPLVKIAPA